jgi:hypothetical protein
MPLNGREQMARVSSREHRWPAWQRLRYTVGRHGSDLDVTR